MRIARSAARLALAAFLAPSLAAQVTMTTVTSKGVVVQSIGYASSVAADEPATDEPTPAEAPPQADSAPAAKSKPGPRLDKLKRLEFDRRPSSILAAWSKPPKTQAEKDAEAKKEAEAKDAAKKDAETKPAADTKPANEETSSAAPTPSEPAKPAASQPAAGATPEDAEAAKKKAEQEAKAKKKAEEEAAKKKKAEAEAAKKAADAKALEEELAAFQRNVTLGDWSAVRAYLATLSTDEQKAAYARLLESLEKGPTRKPGNVPMQGLQYVEKNRFSAADVVGIASAAPHALEKSELATLGKLLKQALEQGHQIDGFLALVRPHLAEKDAPLDRRKLAQLLLGAERVLEMGEFLPSEDEARASGDREGLNLFARFALASHEKDKQSKWLEDAWTATQDALAAGDVAEEAKTEALTRAVDLAPKIRAELGQSWLDESFTKRPERGMEIVAAIGSSTATALQSIPTDADKRLKLLELQTTAAKALLAAAPQLAESWKSELGLLAGNWLREAQVTYQFDDSTQLGPRMQRDNFGNFYYFDGGQQGRRNDVPTAIRTDKILDARPNDAWLAHVEPTILPRFQSITAQLYLKVKEEAQAFPFIETLAATNPEPAKALVDEFLRVWTKNHDPNADRGRTNRYMFFYGFDERADSIPLTRSKQERNLTELADWLARLRKLPVELDQKLVAEAFTAAHSSAEIYRLDAIERIFGPLASLDSDMLAELLQKMRTNLATVWRDPALQKDKKTNRRQQDIQAEVVRGYEIARATLDKAIEGHPDAWKLWLARATLEHDENDFKSSIAKDVDFAKHREAAFETFQKAASLYASQVETLDREKETAEPFELWFYAALGGCDLNKIDHEKQLAPAQIPRIKAALLALPGERATRHVSMFANDLTVRMSNVNPAVKSRYAREGLAIVGADEMARDTRQVAEYYADLVTEIQLVAKIDGSDRVGHARPFGLRVALRHTADIERESGGFGKYLQNQNNASFAFNYGRPTEDYRDKFEEAARAALKEDFDVLSVTFNEPEAHSKADPEYGWRVTPYAYLLLQPRGPQVDRVPPLQLDLDFLDTSGYVVLPISSAAIPIDARDTRGEDRPIQKLALVQTLDERQAKDGRLVLEIKASGTGLVPELGALLDVAPAGFDVARTDDHGVSVVKLDDAGDTVASERTWTVVMKAKDGQRELPRSFQFAQAKVPVESNEHFRYVDADLASVGDVVQLEKNYGKVAARWPWYALGAVVVVALAFVVWRVTRKPKVEPAPRFRVPADVTSFSVLGLLRDIERNDGLASDAKAELAHDIARIERHYFAEAQADAPDLGHVAQRWVARTR